MSTKAKEAAPSREAIRAAALEAIRANPGKTWSQIAALLDLPRRRVESAMYDLWRDGEIQIEPTSTLRVTRPDEHAFRYFFP